MKIKSTDCDADLNPEKQCVNKSFSDSIQILNIYIYIHKKIKHYIGLHVLSIELIYLHMTT